MTTSWRSRLPASPRSPPLSPRFTEAELDLELQSNPKLILRKKQRKHLGYRPVVHEFGLTGPVLGAIWIGVCLFGLLSFENVEMQNARSIHALLELAEMPPRVLTSDLEPRLVVHRGELRVESNSVVDTDVGVRVSRTLVLRRRVEMYQYIKPNTYQYSDVSGGVHSVSSGGYTTGWSEKRIRTNSEQYSNPQAWKIENLDFVPAEVFLGQYALCPEMRRSLEGILLERLELKLTELDTMTSSSEWQLLTSPDTSNRWTSDAAPGLSFALDEDGFIYTGDPMAPTVGDLRIHYLHSPTYNSYATALGELVVENMDTDGKPGSGLSLDALVGEELQMDDTVAPAILGRLKPYPMREVDVQGVSRRLGEAPVPSPQDFTLATPVAETLHLDKVFPLLHGRRRTTALGVSEDESSQKAWSIAMIDVGVVDVETLISKYIQNHSSLWEGALARALFALGICIGSMFALTPAVTGVFFPFPVLTDLSLAKNMLWVSSAMISTGIVCIASAIVHVADSPWYALGMALCGCVVFLSLRWGALLLVVKVPWERIWNG